MCNIAITARRILQAAGTRRWCDPREIAYRLGMSVVVGKEDTSADCVVYAWHVCERERGRRVFVGIATAWLLRGGPVAAGVRAVDVAHELAVPAWMVVAVGIDAILASQLHYPLEMICPAPRLKLAV